MTADILVVGLSYKTAPLDVRERLAFPDADMGTALEGLLALPSIGEAVVLSTCNRVEVYAAGRSGAATGEIRRFLAEHRGVSDESLAGHLYERSGPDAVRHIFRVAASLDSLVVGESQILGQMKSAYGAASQVGSVGPLLGRCLERAFGVAKRVRTETAIARGAANVSSVAVELAKRVFGELAGKIVLVVGAGKMSDLAARHLRADGAAEILVTNRSPERAAELAVKVDGKARPWEDLESLFGHADVVISSTGARDPIVSRDFMKRVMKARRHRPIFVIDIAVPRDIEPAAGKLDGVYLFDIDDLEKVVADNQADRRKEAGSAERIVDGETAEFLRWLRAQGVVPTIKELRERFTQIAQGEAQKLIDKDPASAESLRRLADAIVAKLVHAPTMALRGGEDPEALVVAARRLFSLEDEPK
jgi:glutamyl-tRNA reductase